MASVGAATAPHRKQQYELYQTLKRSKQAAAREALRARAAQVLRELSQQDGQHSLDADDLEPFLKATFHTHHVNPHALQRTIRFLASKQQHDRSDDRFSRIALLSAVERYQDYLHKENMIEDIFHRYNRARDGQLTKPELCCLLQDLERKNHSRYAGGMAIMLIVSPQDLDTIMKKADKTGSGTIDRSELLAALEVWERLAMEKLQLKQMSVCGGCVIL